MGGQCIFKARWRGGKAFFKLEVELIKHGDLVRLEHVITRRNIHSHQQPAPMSKKQFQITGYGEVRTPTYYILPSPNKSRLLYDF